MEVRAHFILVGVFFLLTVFGVLGAIFWLSSDSTGTATSEYDIWFQESVSGLSVGNAVLFSGIRVGTVSQIKISEKDPGAVRVRVSIRSDTPVREDSVATLTLQGITGISLVAITGGTRESPLVHLDGNRVGQILSQRSPLASVINDAGNISARIDQVLENIESMTSAENRVAVTDILASTAKVMTAMAGRVDVLEHTIDRVDDSVTQLNTLVANANKTIGRYDELGVSLNTLSQTLNREIGGFSRESLPQVRQLIGELRSLTHTFTRIGQNLESNPRQFLLGDPVQEYTP